MVQKPTVIQIPSPNYGLPRGTKGRAGHNVLAIVDHIMAGTLVGTDSWFQNTASEVSAHFGVGKNGAIHQYVDENNVAWANGVVTKPTWPLLISGVNPNYYTVSIEHEGQSGDSLTEAQYEATLALHLYLIDYFGLEVSTDTIIGHYRIDGVNRTDCPGSGFPWTRLLNDLKEAQGVKLDNLVTYVYDADLPIAADLALALKCPVILAPYVTPDLLAATTNKFQVGGSNPPTGVTLLSGTDRYDTIVTVLKKLGKI